jgi:hypothetical protein
MITPTSAAAGDVPRSKPNLEQKYNNSKYLCGCFGALLAPHAGAGAKALGHSAGEVASLLEGGQPGLSVPTVPETIGSIREGGAPCADLDPLSRSLALPIGAPLPGMTHAAQRGSSEPTGAGPGTAVLVGLEEAVRRIAWGGDRRRGVARIELGGEHLGTTLVVQGEGREVSLSIELAPGRDAGSLPERLAARLRARGLSLRDVEVR